VGALGRCSKGDMRKAITLMQSAARLYGEVTAEGVEEVAGVVPAACKKNNFDAARRECEGLVADAYPVAQVLYQLAERMVSAEDIQDAHKARIGLALAQADKALTDGADELLQLVQVASAATLALAGQPPVPTAALAR